MVISFKKNAGKENCVVEMDIQDFINLTNLISETANEEGKVKSSLDHLHRTPSPSSSVSSSSSSSSSSSPPSFSSRRSPRDSSNTSNSTSGLWHVAPEVNPTQRDAAQNREAPLLTPTSAMTVSAAPAFSRSPFFWNQLTTDEEPTPGNAEDPGSDPGGDFDIGNHLVSLAVAAALPHVAGLARIVFRQSFYAHPIHFLVHNRSGFWLQDSWNPNTFFTEQSETETWILERMFPCICLLSIGSWIVFLSSPSSSLSSSLSLPPVPVNLALSVYSCFVITHWADTLTTDLGWSCFFRGVASLELFFTTFSFKSWSYMAFFCAGPAFSLYSYLFFVTYKTRQRWKRHQQAINGYDDEVNTNANNSFAYGKANDNNDFTNNYNKYYRNNSNNSHRPVITQQHRRRKNLKNGKSPWGLWKAESRVRLSTPWWSGQGVEWFGGGGVGEEEEEWMTAQRLPVEEFD